MSSGEVGEFGRLRGYVSRAVAREGASVKEWFAVWPVAQWDPKGYLDSFPAGARFVGVQPLDNIPAWDPALVYSRTIPGSGDPAFSVADFFAGNREVEPAANPTRDVSDVEPMSETSFWDLIALFSGQATKDGIEALEGALAELPVAEIEAFARRFYLVLRTLKTEAIADAAHEDVFFPSDASLWWRLAVVAQGREVVASVVGGTPTRVSEREWAAAEGLDLVAERAVERRDGDRPTYVYEPIRDRASRGRSTKTGDIEAMLRAKLGDGTVDLRPGPRTAAAMTERGLEPELIGSRFVVRADGASHECIVMQRIDIHRENVARRLREAAEVVALDLGGTVSTPIEHYETKSLQVIEWIPVFRIRRLWKGTLDEYCEQYGLETYER